MNLFKKAWTSMVLLVFLLSQLLTGSVLQVFASSISPDWETAVQFMKDYKLSSTANSVSEYDPMSTVKREAAAKLFVNLAENVFDIKDEDKSKKCNFKDMDKANPIFQPYIIKACQLGILKGTEEGNFLPKQELKKHQFLTVLARIAKRDSSIEPQEAFDLLKKEGITKENVLGDTVRNLSRIELAMLFKRGANKYANISPEYWKKIEEAKERAENEQKIAIYSKTVALAFDSDMNRESVEKNFKIYPKVKTNFQWKDDKTVDIVLDTSSLDEEEITKDLEYILNVSAEAMTKDGEKIGTPIVKKFKTSGVAKIDFVSPQGSITDLNKNITVRFSKPMVPLTNLDNQASCPITITPNLPGKCVWITTSTFQFRPNKGFPIGGNYQISIAKGLPTIAGDTTINSKTFNITTPKLQVINAPTNIKKDDPLLISFNSDVSLSKFMENFSIRGFASSQLDIKYYTIKTEGQLEQVHKNTISIYPNSGDWGYSKNYNYTIGASMTSERGNVSLGNMVSKNLRTNDLLTDYSPFVYKDKDAKNLNLTNNMRKSYSQKIITKNNPKILLNFYEDMELSKSLFQVSAEYNIKYAKIIDCSGGECKVIDNKKAIVLDIQETDLTTLSVNILASTISNSNDINLKFSTKNYNKLLEYKFVDYRTSCVTFTEDMGYSANIKAFDFGDTGRVNYMSKVYKSSYDEQKCKYKDGLFVYQLTTRLNPDQDFTLKVNKDLLDQDNYELDKAYTFQGHTNKALNEDKSVSLFDNREMIVVPTDINPLGVAIQTINLDKVNVKLCEGDFDVQNKDFIKGETCVNKTVDVKNLGFATNYTVLDLNTLFGKDFTKTVLYLEVSKLDFDKSDYEKKDNYVSYGKRSVFMRTNKNIVWKDSKPNNLVWLTDFRTGEVLSDQIEKIESYKTKTTYNRYGGDYTVTVEYKGELSFSPKNYGVYSVKDTDLGDRVLVTLKSGEQVLVNVNNYYSNTNKDYIYLKTDRPLYKQGDKVYLKGIARTIKTTGYNIKTGNLTLNIRNPQYKNIKTDTVKLSNMGSFDYEFTLPEDTVLGNYTISVGNGTYSFAVQEYEKPDFKIETKSEKDNYVYGDIAKVNVKADYYIGVPLQNAGGNYTIKASNYYFDGGKTKGYIWGENNNWWYYGGRDTSYNRTIEYNKKFTLNSMGKTVLNIKLNNTDNAEATNKTYTISTTVKDPNTSKSISDNINFRVFVSKVLAGMKFDRYYYNYGENATIAIVTVDAEGNKIANQNVDFKITKLSYEKNEDTLQYEEKETVLTSKTLRTNGAGVVSYVHNINDYGRFKFEVSIPGTAWKTTKIIYISGQNAVLPKEQEHNLVILPSKDKYKVGDNAEFVIQSPYVGVKALVTVEKLDGIIGYEIVDIDSHNQVYNLDISRKFLPNFYLNVFLVKDVDNAVDSLAELKTVRAQMRTLEDQIRGENEDLIIPYPIRCYDIIGIIPPISYETIDKDLLNQLIELRKKEHSLLQKILPNYMIGELNVKLSLDAVKLDSKVTTDKDFYLPSDSTQIELTIKDSNGNPINGEATIAVIDDALLALKSDKSTSILDFFYSDKQSNIGTSYVLLNLIKRLDFVNDKEAEEQSYMENKDSMLLGAMTEDSVNFNGGDKMMKSMALPEAVNSAGTLSQSRGSGNASKIREDFKDLAYYRGSVNVVNGKAIVTIPKLPDDLTTWVVKGYAHTLDTKVGEFETTFKTQKQLSIIPSVPRYFMAQDIATITSVVVNNTSSDLSVTSILEMTHASVDNYIQTVNVKANSQTKVTWKVTISPMTDKINWNSYFTDINIKAQAGDLIDQIKLKKRVQPYSTPEYVFTNGNTEDLSYEEKIVMPDYIDKTQGKIDITMGSNVLTNMMDSINNIASMPYINFYSTTSALYRGAILKALYDSIGESAKFQEITVVDYNGETWKLDTIIKDRIKDFADYQQEDGGFSYYEDCHITYYRKTCSDFSLTANFLLMVDKLEKVGYHIDSGIVNKAKTYYKSKLKEFISYAKSRGYEYKNLEPFYVLATIGEKDFVNEYLLASYEGLINKDKALLVLILQKIDGNKDRIAKLIRELKNSTLIEARGTLLPSQDTYWDNESNILSTSYMLQLLMNEGEGEKLLVENLARWLVQQKNEDGSFGSYGDSAQVIDTLTDYINYTGELKDINFDAKAFLNSAELLTGHFDMNNKFDVVRGSYSLADYIKFGDNASNSLGFEKKGSGRLYYDVGIRYFLPVDKIAPRDEGIIISRNYYNYDEYKDAFQENCWQPLYYGGYYEDTVSYGYSKANIGGYGGYNYCNKTQVKEISPVDEGKQGDMLVGEIEVIIPHERNNVVVNNFIPAGAELVNMSFDTTSEDIKNITGQSGSGWRGWDHTEMKNDRLFLYARRLYAGTYKYTYVIKLNHVGKYHHSPAVVEELKKPEIWGRTKGSYFIITE